MSTVRSLKIRATNFLFLFVLELSIYPIWYPRASGFIETDKMERRNPEICGRKRQGDITGSMLVYSEKFEVQHFASDHEQNPDQGERKWTWRVYILPLMGHYRGGFFKFQNVLYQSILCSISILLADKKENSTISFTITKPVVRCSECNEEFVTGKVC